MNSRHDILFEAAGFNATEPREYFLNDCCFGDDVALWLKTELTSRGHPTTEPCQEDWGWHVETTIGQDRYFIGVGCSGPSHADSIRAEWRLIVEKCRTVWEKLTGQNRLGEGNAVFGVLVDILSANPDVSAVRRD
ncbi:MAG TPA: hypothetical protein VGJ05_14680 [Fimbriiglobus sp.]